MSIRRGDKRRRDTFASLYKVYDKVSDKEQVCCSAGEQGYWPVAAVSKLPKTSPELRFTAVKLSVKSDYAARAVLGLSRHYPGRALRIEDLAAEQDIPANYLVQILIELKAQGIVRSVRGKEGGYLLGRPPAQISLGDVLRAVHGAVFDTPALTDPRCPAELRRAWEKLQTAAETAANADNFQQLLDEGAEKVKMYYI